MQKLTGGAEQVAVTGETVRQIINELEAAYPGFRARLVNEEEDRLRPDVAVAVDGHCSDFGICLTSCIVVLHLNERTHHIWHRRRGRISLPRWSIRTVQYNR